METGTQTENDFFFADDLVLDESPTRHYFRQLIQGLVHKNNNMLGVVQGFSSLILMEDDLDEGVRENVEQMRDSAAKAAELAEVILAAAGSARVNPEPADLSTRLERYRQVAEGVAAERDVPLDFTAQAGLPSVRTDLARIDELLPALVRNATEAAAESGGKVTVQITPVPGDQGVDLLVHNTGTVIPREQLTKVFEPFHTTKDGSHYGLGLTAAAVVAGQMGSRLGIRSNEAGTSVWLRLPAA